DWWSFTLASPAARAVTKMISRPRIRSTGPHYLGTQSTKPAAIYSLLATPQAWYRRETTNERAPASPPVIRTLLTAVHDPPSHGLPLPVYGAPGSSYASSLASRRRPRA